MLLLSIYVKYFILLFTFSFLVVVFITYDKILHNELMFLEALCDIFSVKFFFCFQIKEPNKSYTHLVLLWELGHASVKTATKPKNSKFQKKNRNFQKNGGISQLHSDPPSPFRHKVSHSDSQFGVVVVVA